MDLELKCLDSIGLQKQLFEKMLKKKKTEMKKKELNDTTLEITNKTIATTHMKFQPMPQFVNLANSDEEDTSTNEDSDC